MLYIALDFSKAFDSVSYKLNHYGICDPILQWIQSFLENRSQQVVLGGQESSSVKVTSGVPQGTILAPLLAPLSSILCYVYK